MGVLRQELDVLARLLPVAEFALKLRAPACPMVQNAALAKRVADLEPFLSVRVVNSLEAEGIMTVRELIATAPDHLLGLRNFGTQSLAEVKRALAANGLSLPEDTQHAVRP
jgi:DNA-directed RNA polymerase subunit alpha